ncbi:unnamed protein product [Rotaria sp. Silwood2]|nr:unnamed protein product [Rotaria sp. Silwood2]CAF4535770.1 unnamed protein product [Rotaria sp. Silwood2]
MVIEAIILGGCSLLLTAINIVCIISMALIILRIKEVVPLHQDNEDITEFFHHDVKLARDYNKIIHDTESITGANHLATPRFSVSNLNKSISSFLKSRRTNPTHPDKRLSSHTDLPSHIDSSTFADLNDLQMLAKDFNLDIFNATDRQLTAPDSEVKVLCLVNDLLDMCEENPPSFADFYRFQPYGVQKSAQEEQISFYESIIKHLPPKWHDLFDVELQRRLHTHNLEKQRSNSVCTMTIQSRSRSSSHGSFNQPYLESKLVRFQRKLSGSKINSDCIGIINNQEEFSDETNESQKKHKESRF